MSFNNNLDSSTAIKNVHAGTYLVLSLNCFTSNCLKVFSGKSLSDKLDSNHWGLFDTSILIFSPIAVLPVPFLPITYLIFPDSISFITGNSTKYS